MALRLINLVDAPLTRTDFVPVWDGFAMVSTEEGYSVADRLARRWLALLSNKRLIE